jgi:2-keto-3-deoxy-6-phosphogluconate aldolase
MFVLKNISSLIVFNALSVIGKQIQVCAKGGIDLENVRDFLGPDWDD